MLKSTLTCDRCDKVYEVVFSNDEEEEEENFRLHRPKDWLKVYFSRNKNPIIDLCPICSASQAEFLGCVDWEDKEGIGLNMKSIVGSAVTIAFSTWETKKHRTVKDVKKECSFRKYANVNAHTYQKPWNAKNDMQWNIALEYFEMIGMECLFFISQTQSSIKEKIRREIESEERQKHRLENEKILQELKEELIRDFEKQKKREAKKEAKKKKNQNAEVSEESE